MWFRMLILYETQQGVRSNEQIDWPTNMENQAASATISWHFSPSLITKRRMNILMACPLVGILCERQRQTNIITLCNACCMENDNNNRESSTKNMTFTLIRLKFSRETQVPEQNQAFGMRHANLLLTGVWRRRRRRLYAAAPSHK